MEQKDYLKKQIDQLGLVLAKLFSDLLRLKNSEQINKGIEITEQTLGKALDIDIQDLLETPTDNFIDMLSTQKGLKNENLDKLADILLFIADNRKDENTKHLEKCLIIYEHLENIENVYSLDRYWKMKRIKNVLLQK